MLKKAKRTQKEGRRPRQDQQKTGVLRNWAASLIICESPRMTLKWNTNDDEKTLK